MAVTWWSESKKKYVPLSDMHDAHLLAAFRKLERGEYLPGGEPMSDKLTDEEDTALREAFDLEFARRGIGPYGSDGNDAA
jgi:hypothetical protein